MAARILCIIVLLLEIRGFTVDKEAMKPTALIYYTLLSNLLTAVSVLLAAVLGQHAWTAALRYLSTCMLMMTFLVTACVLVPLGGDAKRLLFSGNGLYFHLLCPVISSASYIFAERSAAPGLVWFPPALTVLYGIIMLCLNAKNLVDGPYPFLRVHKQSAAATVIWMAALTAVITAISFLVRLAAG